MPSYVYGDNIEVVVSGQDTMIKPILFTTYDTITNYNLHITYEDSTTKDVELIQNCKDRPYKFIYKKNGKLLSVVGIPKIYEISEESKFCDFANKTMDSDDLLFDVDCSTHFQCIKARFYLKDIRDIIDLVKEGSLEDPDDSMEVFPFTVYPIYLNNHSCQNVIKCEVDDELKVTLTSQITKMGEPLLEDEYSNFQILSVSSPVVVNQDLTEINKVPLIFTEDSLNTEIKVILKYFVKEIEHPVFDEFIIIASKKKEDATQGYTLTRAVSTQDMQYIGDGLEPALGSDLTPGFKEYRYKKSKG